MSREMPTSEVAKLAGVEPYLLRKWKMRGDLKLAPRSVAGAGRGNEAHWSEDAIAEVLARAAEHRNTGYRKILKAAETAARTNPDFKTDFKTAEQGQEKSQ